MIIHGHAEAMIFRRKRSSNSSCQPKLSSRRSSALQQQQRRKSSSNKSCLKDEKRKRLLSSSSLQLTWKDKFLICIGWTDPAKLEIKLRAQMAENLIEKGGEKEEVKDEGKEKEKLNRRTTNKEEKQTIKQPFVVLEEAEYSVPSGGEEEDVDDILERKIEAKIPEENKIDIRRKYLNGIPIGEGDNNNFIFGFDDTPILPSSAMSQVSSSSTSRISQQLASSPNVIVNKLADLYEENLSPSNRPSSSSSSSSIGTGSQRSWIRQQQQPPPQLPRYSDHHQTIDEEEEKLENGKILFLNGKEKTVNKEKSISIEREHVSESSPLSPSNRQLALFPSEEMARLSNNKRYPLTREDIQTRGSLPPLVPKRKQTNGKEAFYHHLKQQQLPTNLNLFPQDLPSHSDEYLTLLLEEPSTPIGNFRPIKASEMLGEESFDNNSYNKTPETASSITTNTTSTSERSDPRLQYANPYSSYAAAMSSPIEIPEETLIKNKKSFQQYSPQMFQNNNRSITTTPQTSLLPFLQRCRQPTPPAIFSSKFEQEHLKQKEMSKIFHFTPPPKYSSSSFSSSGNDSSSLDASTSIIATKNYSSSKIPQYLINKQLKNNIISPIKNNNNNLYDDDDKNLTAIQRRRKQFAEQMPIYKQQQIIDQQYRSPYLLAIGGGDEGGSTSGRGTMPPGYGSSPPTSGSSPEFGHHSKYKISSLSPGRHREQELENYGDSSTTSPEGSPKRKFEIRQRSGLGLGRPLRIPSNNNNEINNKKKRDDKTPTNNNIVTKQSIV